MTLNDLKVYLENLQNEGLTKAEIKTSLPVDGNALYVDETKETFIFATEEEADAKIDDVRQSNGFKSAEKTFKAGKMNKAGELVKPDTWKVVIKLLH